VTREMEETITLHNNLGARLFGILHIPERSELIKKIGIIIANPGIKYRVAPNRLNVILARELCKNGYYVFRFDPAGIGDSDDELPDNMHISDIWGEIQRGRFKDDMRVANEYLIKDIGVDVLVLIGNCGGAITALLAASEDNNVYALCLIDTPIYMWNSTKSFADTLTTKSDRTDYLFRSYLNNMLDIKSWKKLVSFQTNYRALWKVVNLKIKEKIKIHYDPIGNKDLEKLCSEKNLNYLVYKGFQKIFISLRPVLFISAGHDPGRETFETYFHRWFIENYQINQKQGTVEFSLIRNANHVYSLPESRDELFQKIFVWLRTVNNAFESADR